MNSELFKLAKSDLVKALALIVLMAFYSALSNAAGWNIDWNDLLKVVVVGVLAYLTKNFASDSQGKLGGKY